MNDIVLAELQQLTWAEAARDEDADGRAAPSAGGAAAGGTAAASGGAQGAADAAECAGTEGVVGAEAAEGRPPRADVAEGTALAPAKASDGGPQNQGTS